LVRAYWRLSATTIRDKASRRWRGERVLAYATGQRLAHLVGTNEVFASLAEHDPRNEDARLSSG
jgi:hypothetical protein